MEGVGEMSALCAARRVFLTGHTGSEGWWLALWPQHLVARVSDALAPDARNVPLLEIVHVEAGVVSISDGVAKYDHLVSTLCSATPDIVIHMAAQSVVLYLLEPYRTKDVGNTHLLQAIRRVNLVQGVLNINIPYGRCCENGEWIGSYRRNHLLGAPGAYNNSKVCAEVASSSLCDPFLQSRNHVGYAVAVATPGPGSVNCGGKRVMGLGPTNVHMFLGRICNAIARKLPFEIRESAQLHQCHHVAYQVSAIVQLLHTDLNGAFSPQRRQPIRIFDFVIYTFTAFGCVDKLHVDPGRWRHHKFECCVFAVAVLRDIEFRAAHRRTVACVGARID